MGGDGVKEIGKEVEQPILALHVQEGTQSSQLEEDKGKGPQVAGTTQQQTARKTLPPPGIQERTLSPQLSQVETMGGDPVEVIAAEIEQLKLCQEKMNQTTDMITLKLQMLEKSLMEWKVEEILGKVESIDNAMYGEVDSDLD